MVKVMLARGSSGLQVEVLQKALAYFGIISGPIDGLFGPKTEAAVKQFQKAQNLEVDGIAGPKTLAVVDARKKGLDEAAGKRVAAVRRLVEPVAPKAAAAKTATAKATALKSALAKKTTSPKKAESTVAGAAKAIVEAAKKVADKKN